MQDREKSLLFNSERNFKRWENPMHSVNFYLDPDLKKSTVKHFSEIVRERNIP